MLSYNDMLTMLACADLKIQKDYFAKLSLGVKKILNLEKEVKKKKKKMWF